MKPKMKPQQEIDSVPLSKHLSGRLCNILEREKGCVYFGDLLNLSPDEIADIPEVGSISLRRIKRVLEHYGWHFEVPIQGLRKVVLAQTGKADDAPYIPTPKQIEEAKLEVQESWSSGRQLMSGCGAQRYEVRRVLSVAVRNGEAIY